MHSLVAIFGPVKRAQNYAECEGMLLTFHASKIERVARSSLASEVIAIASGVDLSQRYQAYISELSTGQFHLDRRTAFGQLPLLSPFVFGGNHPSLSTIPRNYHSTIGEEKVCFLKRQECGLSVHIEEQMMQGNYQTWAEHRSAFGPSRFRLISVLFTDCANAYSAISSASAPSSEKTIRLSLAYIRDNPVTNILSFCDDRFNLADIGAKIKTSRGIWALFSRTGRFKVSSLGGGGEMCFRAITTGRNSRDGPEYFVKLPRAFLCALIT